MRAGRLSYGEQWVVLALRRRPRAGYHFVKPFPGSLIVVALAKPKTRRRTSGVGGPVGVDSRRSSNCIGSLIFRHKVSGENWRAAAGATRPARLYYLPNWRAEVAGDSLDTAYNPNGSAGAKDVDAFIAAYTASTGTMVTRGVLESGGIDSGLGGKRFGYAGYELDPALRGPETVIVNGVPATVLTQTMYHVRNRVYDAENGRWTRRDPPGYVDGMGLCEYCRSGPSEMTEPSGLIPMDSPRGPSGLGPGFGPRGYPDVPEKKCKIPCRVLSTVCESVRTEAVEAILFSAEAGKGALCVLNICEFSKWQEVCVIQSVCGKGFITSQTTKRDTDGHPLRTCDPVPGVKNENFRCCVHSVALGREICEGESHDLHLDMPPDDFRNVTPSRPTRPAWQPPPPRR